MAHASKTNLADYEFKKIGIDAEGRNRVSVRGWFDFHREFALYAHREDLGRNFDKSCVSGRFVRPDLEKSGQDFQGKRVEVIGFYTKTRDLPPEAAPFVENYCDGDYVIYGTEVRILGGS